MNYQCFFSLSISQTANFPPNITEGETLLLAEVGVESQMRIKAYDIDGDTISFSQQYPISNSTLQQISSTGEFIPKKIVIKPLHKHH